ncbi:hypothetical protein D3C78_1211410 [compost metagenome]
MLRPVSGDRELLRQQGRQAACAGGKIPAAADRAIHGAGQSSASKKGQNLVGHLLTKGSEGGPLAADHAELWRIARNAVDEMAAGYFSGKGGIAARQRAYAAETEDNVGMVDGNLRKDLPDRLDNIIPLLGLAAHPLGPIHLDIGRASENPAEIGKEDTDAIIGILEKDHMAVQGLEKRVVGDDQM